MAIDVLEMFAALSGAPNVSQGPLLERLIWTMLAVSTVVVMLRLYVKLTTARRLFVDDWFMVTALVCAIVHASLIQVAIKNGFGKHILHISLASLSSTMKFGVLSLMWGFLSPMFGRISFSCTLLFLTRTDAASKTWPIYTLILLQVVVNLVGVVVFYSQCRSNVDTFWTLEKQLIFDELCWDPRIQTYYGYFMGSCNTFTDVYLAVLPAILIHRTSMSLKRKFGVAALLCLSILAMASSIVKLYEAKILSEVTDYTYNLAMFVIAMVIELNLVIITASIPILRPLLNRRRESIVAPDLCGLHQIPTPRRPRWNSHIPLSSAFTSKNRSRTNTVADSDVEYRLSDEFYSHELEKEFHHSAGPAVLPAGRSGKYWVKGDERGAVIVTTEVEVTYQAMEAPRLHAALVGLYQGEVANPKLARTGY